MSTIDLTPLYRNTIGFDHFGALLDSALRSNKTSTGFPPYDIEMIEDDEYCIRIALAGYSEKNIDIEVERGTLTVRGKPETDSKNKFLYRGISCKAFEQKFSLAEYIEVDKAYFDNGLLCITLHREVPDELKPRRIEINSKSKNILEHKTSDAA